MLYASSDKIKLYRIKKSMIITKHENLWYKKQKVSSLILASSSYKNKKQDSLKISVEISHENFVENRHERVDSMIDCEAIEVNYIDINFVRSIEANQWKIIHQKWCRWMIKSLHQLYTIRCTR